MSRDSWKDWDVKGRATFRPPASEVGRPVFHPDAEEAEGRLRQLKQEVRSAEKERDNAKADLVRAEKKIKRRDHRIFKELEDHQLAAALPKNLSVLVKECLLSGQAEEVRMLREKVALLEASGGASAGMLQAGVHGARVNSVACGGTSTPRAKDTATKLAARFEEATPVSPLRRQQSDRSVGSSRNLQAGVGGVAGGGDALQAARAEVERLQKLCAAHEVIHEGLQKRVAQLEALNAVNRNEAPMPKPGAPAVASAGGECETRDASASLYTEDGPGFDNYIRRLAGLSELAPPAHRSPTGQQQSVKLHTYPKGKPRPAVHVQGAAAEREVVYEVTCQTGDSAGAGTSSNCYITFRGKGGEFGPCALDRSDAHQVNSGVGVLAASATDVFDIVARNVEPIECIILSHDSTGEAPSWFVRTVIVRRGRSSTSEAKTYRFEWDNWVGAPPGTAATTPASVTIFPVLLNKEAAGTRLRSSVKAPAAHGSAKPHAFAGAGAGGADPGGRVKINKEAVSDACASLVSAVRGLHMPSTASHDAGLLCMARLIGGGSSGAVGGMGSSKIEIPVSCRNLTVLLLGPRSLCTEVVEWFSGCKMGDTGLSTETRFTLVQSLPPSATAPRYSVGEDSKGQLGKFAKLADSVPQLLASFAVSQVPSTNMRMAQVDLLHPPLIEGNAPSSEASSLVQEALQEIGEVLQNQSESLYSIFKDMDKDGGGTIDENEFKAALQKLDIDMPESRAERIFKVLDVSGDGDIEYGEFLAAFKPARTNYAYDLEAAMEASASNVDLIIVLVDPKSIHYNARELALIGRLHSSFGGKLRMACYIRDAIRTDTTKLRCHILPAARQRLEEAMGLASNTLNIPNLWVDTGSGESEVSAVPLVKNQIDEILIWIKDALLALEYLAVDETEHNIRVLLDLLWSSGDTKSTTLARANLADWMQAWRDATGFKSLSASSFCASPA